MISYTMKHMKLLSKLMHDNKTLQVLKLLGFLSPKLDVLHWLTDINLMLLQQLILNDCKIGFTGVSKVGEILSCNSSITHVDLTRNEIDDNGVEILAHYLKSNNTLESFDLSSNKITAIGVIYLKETIANLDYIIMSIRQSSGTYRILSCLRSSDNSHGKYYIKSS